jgi:hypothetical protein
MARKEKSKESMSKVTHPSEGKIAVPIAVQKALTRESSDKLECKLMAISVTSLKGLFEKPSKEVSFDDMNQAIMKKGSKFC